MKTLFTILFIATVAVWAYLFGTVNPAMQVDRESTAWQYIYDTCQFNTNETGRQWYECNTSYSTDSIGGTLW